MKYSQIIQALCDELKVEFNIESISSGLLADGGYDFHAINTSDIVNAIDGKDDVPWSDLAFGCAETLAYHQCIRIRKTPDEQIVRALLNIMLLGKSLNKGFGDWGFEFEKMLAYLLHVKDRVEPQSLMTVLSKALEGWSGQG